LFFLRNRLAGLKPDVLKDPICFGLFGSTGAGKSTLLNALLEKKYFLPVSGSQACTSCVVQVNTSRNKYYEAKIYLLNDEARIIEWKDELKNLVALMETEEDSEQDVERDENALKICAIYGKGAEKKTYKELCDMKPIVNIPASRCFVFKETQEEAFSKKLEPYIRTPNINGDTEAELSKEDQKMQFWPLIKNVEVTLPKSNEIPEGVIFLDIPGTGDFNNKRDMMWKENINKCSVIWVVSGIVRIQGDKTHETLLNEGMKAFQSGMCRDLALVITKSDDLDLEEYKRSVAAQEHTSNYMKLINILKIHVPLAGDAYNLVAFVLQMKLPSDSEVRQKVDLVYTVSARDYWQGRKLSKEETEIPKLRKYIWNFYASEKKKELKDYVEEAFLILSLFENLQSNQDKEHLHANKGVFTDLILEEIPELDKDIEKCFALMETPLEQGITEAKKSYKKIMNKFLNRDCGYQGYHKTLKAVCLKKGVYTSRKFDRIDVNEALAQPIYEKIDTMFGNIFRIQFGTRATLKANLLEFKSMVQSIMEEKKKLLAKGCLAKFLQQEMDVIISETEQLILQRKATIYCSLAVSIQRDLLSCYEEAAKIRGPQAYQRMQNVISQGIKSEVEKGMFEKAAEEMKRELQKLK
ncbi:SLIP GTPase, partial [Crypturellus undulatus]|nr:SLIP GTPase [Crypturellus undulatus]